MKPIIGITSHVELNYKHTLNHEYITAIERAGGIPILIPIGIEADLERLLSVVQGVLVTGGGDIDPDLFGEEPHPKLGEIAPGRDELELKLVQIALEKDLPMIGICRGMQIMNIAIGGDMYQDIYSQMDQELLQHSQRANRSYRSHYIDIEEASLMKEIAGQAKIRINSYHHQAVRSVPAPFKVSGTAKDTVIEAIESTAHRFVLGLQWHPEALASDGDAVSLALFTAFIEQAKKGIAELAPADVQYAAARKQTVLSES